MSVVSVPPSATLTTLTLRKMDYISTGTLTFQIALITGLARVWIELIKSVAFFYTQTPPRGPRLPQYLRPLLRRQGAIRAKGALSLKGIEPRRGPEPIFRNFGGVGVRIDVMPRIVKILRLRYLDNFTH